MKQGTRQYLREAYTYILIPDAMGGYSAEILEFPGCFTEGETANKAIKALEDAACEWVCAALAQGQEIPRPFNNQGYGGKVALRLPKSMHRQAMRFAERDGVSLNQFLVATIAARVGAEEYYNRLPLHLLQNSKEHLSAATTRIMMDLTVQGLSWKT